MIQDFTLPQQSRPGRFSERTCPSGAGAGVKVKERDEGKRLREEGGVSPAGMGISEASSLKCIGNMRKLLGMFGLHVLSIAGNGYYSCPKSYCFVLFFFSAANIGEIWVWLKLFFLLLECLEASTFQ